MIDPVFLLVLILFVAGTLNSVFKPAYLPRYIAASAPGLIILAYGGWEALFLAIFSLIVFSILFLLARKSRNKRVKNFLPYLGLFSLLIPDYSNALENWNILFIGSAFFIIRQFVTVKECIKQTIEFRVFLLSSGLATFFFASLFTGPVFSGLSTHQQLEENLASKNRDGLFKLLEGFTYILPITSGINYLQSEVVTHHSYILSYPVLPTIVDMLITPLLAFLFIFTSFFGYSKVAEGVANLLGFDVPVNFNQPQKSKNFADFWQRWHRKPWDHWTAIQKNIWLWQVTNMSLLDFAKHSGKNSTAIVYYETLLEEPDLFWKNVLEGLGFSIGEI